MLGESTIQFMSVDQDASDFASGDFHIVLHDEPPTHAIWRENQARTMRVNGRMLLAMTWPDDPSIPVDWLFDELYEPANEGAKNKKWINLWTTENKHLDQAAVSAQMEDWSDNVSQVRIYGKPIRFSNRIHSLFTDQDDWWCFRCGTTATVDAGKCIKCGSSTVSSFNHVGDFEVHPSWPSVWVLDPHPRKPHMYQWWQVDPSDDIWMVATGECDGEPRAVRDDVYETEKRLGLNVRRRLIDPNMGRSPSSATKRHIVWQDEFDAVGLNCDLADDSDVGRGRFNEYLEPDPMTMAPRVHIHPRCTRAIFQIKRFVWDEFGPRSDRDSKQVPKPKNDDDPAMIRYFLNSDPTFGGLHESGIIRRRDPRPKAGRVEAVWRQ